MISPDTLRELAFNYRNAHPAAEEAYQALERYVLSASGTPNLRDHFAGFAMQAHPWQVGYPHGFPELARSSYEMADAMLKEREK